MAPGLCVTSLRMFMRHAELRHLARVSCGQRLKPMPIAALAMNSWNIRMQAFCTDKSDEYLKDSTTGQTNHKKASLAKNGTQSSSAPSASSATTTNPSDHSNATIPTTPKTTTIASKPTKTKIFDNNQKSKTNKNKKSNANDTNKIVISTLVPVPASSSASASDTASASHMPSTVSKINEAHLKDFTRFNVYELKAELRARNLHVGGTKKVLIERLKNYIQEEEGEQQQNDNQKVKEKNDNKNDKIFSRDDKQREEEILKTNASTATPSNRPNPPTGGEVEVDTKSSKLDTMEAAADDVKITTQKLLIPTNDIDIISKNNNTNNTNNTNNNYSSSSISSSSSNETQTTFPFNSSSAQTVKTDCDGDVDGDGEDNNDRTSKINHSTTNGTVSMHHDVSVEYIQGLPHLTIPLPSRHEKCRFALKPVSHKVGDLIEMLKTEDRGIDRAAVLNEAGVRIASTCNIESLMDEPFWLHINDQKYKVVPPVRERIKVDDLSKMGDIRALVAQLYEALHVGEYHLQKEQEMTTKLEDLKYKLAPLERQKTELSAQAERRTNIMTWVGLGLMSVQFGILARLTWWEYSWDIMEPVTYFVTYGTAMAMYAYFCITKTEYNMPEVKDRQYLLTIHKRAKRANFDVDVYNSLKRQIAELEYDLRRLHDPLNMQLPPHVDRSQQHPPPSLISQSLSSSSTSSGSSQPALTTRLSNDG